MPVESRDDGFPITLKIPHQRFVKRFHSASEVETWIRSEVELWGRLNNFSGSSTFPDPSQHLAFLRLLTTDRFGQALSAGSAADMLRNVEQSQVLLSEGKQGEALAEVHAASPSLYPGALAALAAESGLIDHLRLDAQGTRYPLPWTVWMSGLGALRRLSQSSKDTASQRQRIDDLILEAQSLTEEIETRRRTLDELHQKANDRFDRLADAQVESAEKTGKHFSALLQDKLDESSARIAELEEQVTARLVLEAPTTYWSKKAISHRNTAILFGLLFLCALGGGVYWITHEGVALVGEAYQTIVGERENPGLLALVPLAFITLPTLAFAWLLRHVSRIIVQNLSLQADAQLRGTIATTYSALTSQAGSTPAELAIALNALFRPMDGSGHAEIAPPNIRDILEMGK